MGFRRKKRGVNNNQRSLLKSEVIVAKQRKVKISNRDGARRFRPNPVMNRIVKVDGTLCIIRSVGGIGDVLMITPAIRALKEKYPKLTITVAVDRHRTWDDSYYKILANAPFIDKLIDARYVNRREYDKVIDISAVCIPYERRGLPNRNRIDLFAAHLGINYLKNHKPFYKVSHEEYLWARNIIVQNRKSSNSIIIGFNPSSNDNQRSWKPRQARALIIKAREKNPEALIILFDWHKYAEDLYELDNVINMSSTSIRQMGALIQQCHVFIGPDSGPMHLAAALNRNTIALFGSVPPEARINHYPTHEPITASNMPCLGCWYEPCPYAVKCMETIEASIVLQRALNKVKFSNKVGIGFNPKAHSVAISSIADIALGFSSKISTQVYGENDNNKYFKAMKELLNKSGNVEKLLYFGLPDKDQAISPEFFNCFTKYIYLESAGSTLNKHSINLLNTYDKVFVPSLDSKTVLNRLGVKVPILVIEIDKNIDVYIEKLLKAMEIK